MKLLDAYVVRTILVATLLVAFAFAAIAAGMNFLDELKHAGKHDLGLLVALQCALLTLPKGIYDLFPIIVLLGTMLGMGGLASGSELIAIRASGVSLLRMALSAALAGLLLAGVAIGLGEVAVPQGLQLADSLRTAVQTTRQEDLNRNLWLRDGDSFIRIGTVVSTHMLGDVHLYRFGPDRRLQLAARAANARYQDGSWQLIDVQLSQFGDSGVEARRRSSLSWRTSLSPRLLRGSVQPPEEQNFNTLRRTVRHLKHFGLESTTHELALWRKFTSPVLCVLMTLLSLPFVLGPLRSTGAGERMFAGIVVGAALFFLSEISTNTSQVYELSPLLSAWLPTAVVAAIAVAWLWLANSPGRISRLLRLVSRQ